MKKCSASLIVEACMVRAGESSQQQDVIFLLTKEMRLETVISCVDEIQVDRESQSSADKDISILGHSNYNRNKFSTT